MAKVICINGLKVYNIENLVEKYSYDSKIVEELYH